MRVIERDTPGIVITGDALLRAVAVLGAVGAPEVTMQSRANALLLGSSWEGQDGCSTVLMISGATDGSLSPVVVQLAALEAAASSGRDCRLRLTHESLMLESDGFSLAVPDPRRPQNGPDLLASRLGPFRSNASLRADDVAALARLIAAGRGDPVDGVAVSPAGWAGTSDGAQLGVAPLVDWTHGHQIVVPGRLFRAARAFGPDEVTLEVNRRRDDARLVRLVAFAGRDMLVLEDLALASRFPDLREILTEPVQPIVVVDDTRGLRAVLVRLLSAERVLLYPGRRPMIDGWDETGSAVSLPFEGWVREPLELHPGHLLDLLAGFRGPVELCCDDQRRQPVCVRGEDGSRRGLWPLGSQR